jgi:hypothetical protein
MRSLSSTPAVCRNYLDVTEAASPVSHDGRARSSDEGDRSSSPEAAPAQAGQGALSGHSMSRCVICERSYEKPDMAHCPAYQGAICSLCCTLDARCGDMCKPQASLSAQWSGALRWVLPRSIWQYLDTGLAHFLLMMLVIVPVLAGVFGFLYVQELRPLAESVGVSAAALRSGFVKAYFALLVIAGVVAWWMVLAHKSRQVAQEESNRQTHLLMQEIESHRQTDEALQQAKQLADQANQAKSRYISAISHELRTPLNSILGYAQLMGEDPSIPPHRRQAWSSGGRRSVRPRRPGAEAGPPPAQASGASWRGSVRRPVTAEAAATAGETR